MTKAKKNLNGKKSDNKAACCASCDCTTCSCGCQPGACQCAAGNCQCGCRA